MDIDEAGDLSSDYMPSPTLADEILQKTQNPALKLAAQRIPPPDQQTNNNEYLTSTFVTSLLSLIFKVDDGFVTTPEYRMTNGKRPDLVIEKETMSREGSPGDCYLTARVLVELKKSIPGSPTLGLNAANRRIKDILRNVPNDFETQSIFVISVSGLFFRFFEYYSAPNLRQFFPGFRDGLVPLMRPTEYDNHELKKIQQDAFYRNIEGNPDWEQQDREGYFEWNPHETTHENRRIISLLQYMSGHRPRKIQLEE